MKPQVIFSICAIAALILACSTVTVNVNSPTAVPAASAAVQATSQPTSTTVPTQVSPTDLPPSLPPTETAIPVPSLTPIPTLVSNPTPSEPTLTTIDKPVNCRFGPGTEYSVVGYFLLGESARIEGKASDSNWWYIRTPKNPDLICWVAGSVTQASGDLALVKVVPPPEVLVTDVSLKLDPRDITVPGCVFPYTPVTLTGSITTNGPAIVEWHWETSQGNVTSSQVIKFTKFGTLTVSDYVKYGAAGTFWVKLVVTSPNSDVAKAEYKVVCGP